MGTFQNSPSPSVTSIIPAPTTQPRRWWKDMELLLKDIGTYHSTSFPLPVVNGKKKIDINALHPHMFNPPQCDFVFLPSGGSGTIEPGLG